MNANVIVGLTELFAYWGAIYALAGNWWVTYANRVINWAERTLGQ